MIRLFALFAFCALFIACNEEGKKQVTSTGEEFIIHQNGEGEASKLEDYIFFEFKVVTEDGQVLQHYNDPENYPVIQLLSLEEAQQPNPLMEVMMGRKVGDSLTLFIPKEDLGIEDERLAASSYITYNVKVTRINNEEQQQAMQDSLVQVQKAKAESLKVRENEVAELIKADLEAFSAGKLDVKTTASGLQYHIHEEGNGQPTAQGEMANVHYYGAFYSGEMFDNSYRRGKGYDVAVGTGGVIKGWDEALLLLNRGTKATLFIPSDLAYGKTGNAGIPGDTDLAFYIEIGE